MKRCVHSLLFLTLLSNACSATLSTPQTALPVTTEAPTFLPTTPASSNPGECGYQWAYQGLPELSGSFQQSLQALQAEAQGKAYIFGENCILADGSIGRFLARETDFDITLRVSDLNDESDLGAWIVNVMQIVTNIPSEQIVGPLPGRIFLVFESGSDQRAINFGIDQFKSLPAGLSDAEIFQSLQVPQ